VAQGQGPEFKLQYCLKKKKIIIATKGIAKENVLRFYTILSPICKTPSTEPGPEWVVTKCYFFSPSFLLLQAIEM
jgi:hypothetical protein